tara:strand:- start:253 stop:708 length:456 start_codon:yes stop_codon:yes gene_type:complete
MNSNNYNSGLELNIDISNIESMYWIQPHETRSITIDHSRSYDSVSHEDSGVRCASSNNSGFVMSNYDAESRCRYLNDKYKSKVQITILPKLSNAEYNKLSSNEKYYYDRGEDYEVVKSVRERIYSRVAIFKMNGYIPTRERASYYLRRYYC